MEIAMKIGEKIVEYAVKPIGLSYLFYHNNNVEELKNQVEKLGHTKQRMQHSLNKAKRKGEELEQDVKKWLKTEDRIVAEANKLVEDASEANTSWFNIMSRHQLSRKNSNMAMTVSKIEEEGRSLAERGVSYRVPPQGIGTTSIKGYEAFESRMSTLGRVIEALKSDNINMIGVYGMGGIGKTMLVNEVARQVKQDNLFDNVVMTVVSQTPNFRKIQGEIADKLDLQFKEETIKGRADRLHEQLKTEKKILVIIDDIWEELDLEAVGISFGDDQKKCKLLFTSRFEHVLRNDMGIQNIFPLGFLCDDEARHLFRKIVGSLVEDQDFDPVVVDDVVKEYAGLPIAITTVANALKNKKLHVWKDAVQQLRRSNPTNIKGMSDKVYHSIELSYNFLRNEEAQLLLLLCSLHREDANINIDSLLRYGMGLDLFQDVNRLEAERNMVHTLVDTLKSACLLLHGNYRDTVKMHDVIRDVAIHIAAKDKRMLVIGNDVNLQEQSKKEKLKDSTAISLPYTNVCELPERLECPQLKLFLLFNKNIPWQIPQPFFEGMKELQVLNLTGISCRILSSSLSFLQNLQMLCLANCKLEDISLIGELKELKVLSLSYTNIEQLPEQIRQLTNLKVLDLSLCRRLKVIPPNILSNLKMLEELYMKDSFTGWEVEGQSSEGSNARVTELDHLSRLTTLEIDIPSTKILPKALIFEKLVRYNISVGHMRLYQSVKTSTTLKINLGKSFELVNGIRILLKSCKELYLGELKGVQNILYELNSDGFPQLKHLDIRKNDEIQYIINLMGPPAFPVLESIYLYKVNNLENICHGPLAVESFRNLREVKVDSCDNMKFVFSSFAAAGCFPQLQQIEISSCRVMGSIVGTEREDEIEISNNIGTMEFPQLRSLVLRFLPKLTCWFGCDVESRGILFNEKVSFPNLESLEPSRVHIIDKIWHDQLPLISSCFQNLTNLTVSECHNLKCLSSSSSVMRSLPQLKDLKIYYCDAIEEILVTKESGEEVLIPKLETLLLFGLPRLKRFCSGNSIELPSLKSLEIQLTVFIEMNSLCTGFIVNKEVEEMNNDSGRKCLFNEKVALPNLEIMIISRLDNLRMIWHHQLVPNSFCKLKEIDIWNCESLKSLFSISVAKHLIQLENLEICECKALEDIVAKEEGLETEPKKFVFPRLNSLILHRLPNLKSFYPGKYTLDCPSLEVLKISDCCNVKMFASDSEVSFQETNGLGHGDITIQQPFFWINKDTFANLKELNMEWTDAMNETWQGQFPVEFFCKLKTLYLHNCCYNELSLSVVQRLCNLEELDLRGNDTEVKLPISLKELSLRNMPIANIFKEVKDSQTDKAFQNLEDLMVWRCSGLKNLGTFPISLQNLKTLQVKSCNNITEIFGNEGGDAGDHPEIVFNQLKSLKLEYLPRLTSFHPGNCTMKFPSLNRVEVLSCPKLKIFSQGVLSTPMLSQASVRVFPHDLIVLFSSINRRSYTI